MNNNLYYKSVKSDKSLADFIHSFWVLKNESDKDLAGIVIPDGRFELFFLKLRRSRFKLCLRDWKPKQSRIRLRPILSYMQLPLSEEMATNIPNADLVVFQDAGELIEIEKEEKFFQTVSAFIDRF